MVLGSGPNTGTIYTPKVLTRDEDPTLQGWNVLNVLKHAMTLKKNRNIHLVLVLEVRREKRRKL